MWTRSIVFVMVGVAALGVAPLPAQEKKEVPADLVTHKVTFQDLQLKIVERGSLESADPGDLKCEVKVQPPVTPTIKWVIDEGSKVKKGDLLLEIDDTSVKERAAARKSDLDKANAALEAVEQEFKLKSQHNQIAVKSAESALELARLELKKFDEGDAEVMRKEVKSRLAGAEADVALWRARVAEAEQQLKDGKTTEEMVKAKRLKQEATAAVVDKIKAEADVLEKHTLPGHRKQLAAQVDIAQARLELEREQGNVLAKASKAATQVARADREKCEALYKDELEQIKSCKLYAPRDGVVVYFVPERNPRGGSPIVAQGEPVQYGQKLLSVPDLSHMLVNVRVPEAVVSKVKAGQPVVVQVDAFPGRQLKAHVKSVASVAEQQNGKSPDVKVYQTNVVFDDDVKELNLKPGLSAAVTIFTDSKVERVLTVPARAVLLPKEKEKKSRCLVATTRGAEERAIVVGISDGTMVEVKSGLNEGEEVILNWRSLVPDKK
jgi:multidrug resistance efflux pump